jgi:outer membrane lipoprotein-sorting protein
LIPARPAVRAAPLLILAAMAFAALHAEGGTDGAGADPAAAWVAFARSCFAGVDTVEAAVAHEVIHPLGAASAERRGVLRLKRGGLFRLEYGGQDPIVVVSDGRVIRSWDPARRLAVEEPADGSALAAAFALALGGERGEGAVRWLGGGAKPEDGSPAALAIELARSAPPASRVAVALGPTCPSLARIAIAQGSGAAIRITLSDVRLGVRFPGRPFAFTPPRGARIVRP